MRLAASAGVSLFSLTDHDTVDGVSAALSAGASLGVRVVPGIEVSAVQGGGLPDVHVLGYLVDVSSSGLASALGEWRADRELRAERMLSRLVDAGWRVDRADIDSRRATGRPVGRPHLALAVLGLPENAPRLAAEGIEGVGPFIERWLVEGAPAWLPRTTPSVAEAMDVLHAAGGVAVWAHPFFDVPASADVLDTLSRFRSFGLDGVEAFYPTHGPAEAGLLCSWASEHGLLATGSSDFHGPGRPGADRFRAFSLHGLEPRLGPLAGA